MAYELVGFVDNTVPDINAENLNHMDNGIKDADANATEALTKAESANDEIISNVDSLQNGENVFITEWEYGGWNDSNGWSTVKYRIHTKESFTFSKPVTIYVKEGYRVRAINSTKTGTIFNFINGPSWGRISANTEFYLDVGKYPQNTSEVIDINTTSKAVYMNGISYENENSVSFNENNIYKNVTGGNVSFNYSDFEVGDIVSSTGALPENSLIKYRVRSKQRKIVENDTLVYVESGYSVRMFLYANNVADTTTPNPKWVTGAFVIPANTYYTLNIKKTDESTSDVLLSAVSYLENLSFEPYEEVKQRGYRLLTTKFVIGGIYTSGEHSGEVNRYEKYRVASSTLLYAEKDTIIFMFNPNLEYNFYTCNYDGTVRSATTWQQKGYVRIIEQGTYYKIAIEKVPKVTSEVLTEAEAEKMWKSLGIVDDFCIKNRKISAYDLNPDQSVLVHNFCFSKAKQLVSNSDPKPLVLLHFSDIHANRFNWDRICDFINDVDNYLAYAIHTGDYVGDNQTSYIDLYSRKKPKRVKILNVVGNHDMYENANHDIASQATTYGLLFSDITGWDVTWGAGNNIMYYYKDFTASKIRLIVIDQYYWDATESTWLSTVLEDAKTNGYAVVTAMHTQSGNVLFADQIDCTFSAYESWDDLIPTFLTPASDIIKSFIDGGGNYICNLCGHWHHDVIGYDANGLLNITIPCATYDNSGGWQNGERVGIEKSIDCFNVIGLDTLTHTIRIARIGNNADYFGRRKNEICLDYTNGNVIFNE